MTSESPVTLLRRRVAVENGLHNVSLIARASRVAGVPFSVACALIEKESGGRNVYGRSDGSEAALSGYPYEVSKGNYAVFRWLVIDQGWTSNGVGPAQITYAGSRGANGRRSGGYFTEMEAQGLRPYDPYDNIFFGLSLLRGHFESQGSWEAAGTRYNGDPAYGADLMDRIRRWKALFRAAEHVD